MSVEEGLCRARRGAVTRRRRWQGGKFHFIIYGTGRGMGEGGRQRWVYRRVYRMRLIIVTEDTHCEGESEREFAETRFESVRSNYRSAHKKNAVDLWLNK